MAPMRSYSFDFFDITTQSPVGRPRGAQIFATSDIFVGFEEPVVSLSEAFGVDNVRGEDETYVLTEGVTCRIIQQVPEFYQVRFTVPVRDLGYPIWLTF